MGKLNSIESADAKIHWMLGSHAEDLNEVRGMVNGIRNQADLDEAEINVSILEDYQQWLGEALWQEK